ncbi:MAG: putative protein serine/threonine kinase [Streblomastix strix]|uniref:Tau-tubulin kinase 1 n=1 Tax=Streblomastix strix TaxID=222440 RepID=A0A5J4TQ77_9EUKA|nr:MAG: putative protein serine/threonine kinase [Streblomastix strix]
MQLVDQLPKVRDIINGRYRLIQDIQQEDMVNYKKPYKFNLHSVTTPTNKAKFRGSLLYSSLNAHNLVELGRNDDLISLLYILVEFYNGMLPWSDVDELKVQALKEYFHSPKLLKRLPKQFLEFESYTLSLAYTTDPEYAYLISLLKQAAEEKEIDLNDPFQWEEEITGYKKK